LRIIFPIFFIACCDGKDGKDGKDREQLAFKFEGKKRQLDILRPENKNTKMVEQQTKGTSLCNSDTYETFLKHRKATQVQGMIRQAIWNLAGQ
jgi:hypothetical protein